MKAAVLVGPKKFEVKDVPKPEISDDEVLLKVRACGVCGSDLGICKHGPYFAEEQILGHEFVGEIVEVGKNVKGWNLGARVVVDPYIHCFKCPNCKSHNYNLCDIYSVTGVTVNGAYAEYVKVHPYQMIPLPESMSDEVGTLFQPIACALHAVRLGTIHLNDTVVVVGAGVIGLFSMIWARLYGAGKIVAVEIADTRLREASSKGLADIVINPLHEDATTRIKEITGDLGAPVVIECSGSPLAQRQAIDYVRKGGTIVVYGTAHGPTEANWMLITTKEITIKGGLSAGPPGSYEFSIKAWEDGLLETGKIDIVGTSIEKVTEVFEESIKGNIVKAVFRF
ncbi:MAG: zinc-dependent alcohol dehydrogenase [Thermacetogeniaceae bacterium]